MRSYSRGTIPSEANERTVMSRFCLGVSSSITGAQVGPIVREEELTGHVLHSYRGGPMGVEIGDGCVAFRDPSEHEELYLY